MLYPKKNEPFSDKDFANPGSEYRAAPFWSWNNKLDKQELLWQIEKWDLAASICMCVPGWRRRI